MEVSGRGSWALLVLFSLLFPTLSAAEAPQPPAGALFGGATPLRMVRYSFENGAWPNTLPPLCAMARDIPLIQETGATVVYTRGAPPDDGDHIFLSVLASTGLRWIAAYPLPDDIDPSQPLLTQREAILNRFALFAERYRGNPSLRAVVLDFGTEHLVESAMLAGEFATILRAQFPENTPLLGHAAYSPLAILNNPAGVSFWLYRFAGNLPTAADRAAIENRASLPVVHDLSMVARELVPEDASSAPPTWGEYLDLFTDGDESVSVMAADFAGRQETAGSTTVAAGGGPSTTVSTLAYRPDALFVGTRDTANFENLEPTVFATQLRQAWRGDAPEESANAPVLSTVLNEATRTSYLSAGTRIRARGNLLSSGTEALAASDWPLHIGATCICLAERPIPLASLTGSEAVAQIPWLAKSGATEARVVRHGLASEPLLVDLLPLSPGIFPTDIQRNEMGCTVNEANGVKPGETLNLRVTGAGPLNGNISDIQAYFNDSPIEVQYAGLISDEPGVARVSVRVPQAPGNGDRRGIFVRRGAQSSNIVPVAFAGDARPTVGLVASASEILVQPGGTSAAVSISTQGLNGYCGPVEFEVLGLPAGISAMIEPVQSGQTATLRLRAQSLAGLADSSRFFLYAIPTPGDLASLSMEVSVLPNVGEMQLTLESAGYHAGSQAAISWNGSLLPPTGKPNTRGLYLLLVNPSTGVFSPVEHYDVFASKEESNRLEVRLGTLRMGTIVGIVIADDATHHMQPSLRQWIQARLGSTAITTLGYQNSWAILSKVGSPAPIAEAASAGEPVRIEQVLTLPER